MTATTIELTELELDRIRRTRDWIIADQRIAWHDSGTPHWEQGYWFTFAEDGVTIDVDEVRILATNLQTGYLTDCRSSCCIAGYVVFDDIMQDPLKLDEHASSTLAIEDRATDVLALSTGLARWLFNGNRYRSELVAALDMALENGKWPTDDRNVFDRLHVDDSHYGQYEQQETTP